MMQVIRWKELSKMVGRASRSTIRRWEKKGEFPRRRRLGPNSVGWVREEVEDWIRNRDSPPSSDIDSDENQYPAVHQPLERGGGECTQ